MKKLLLITVVAGGLAFASAPRSDAQVYFSIGFGPGYYGYYPYRYYRPYLRVLLWALLLVRRASPLPASSLLSVLSCHRTWKSRSNWLESDLEPVFFGDASYTRTKEKGVIATSLI